MIKHLVPLAAAAAVILLPDPNAELSRVKLAFAVDVPPSTDAAGQAARDALISGARVSLVIDLLLASFAFGIARAVLR